MVETDFLKEYYWGNINQLNEWKAFCTEEITEFTRIREKYGHNAVIVEACREIIFYAAREIKEYAGEIADCRRIIKQIK